MRFWLESKTTLFAGFSKLFYDDVGVGGDAVERRYSTSPKIFPPAKSTAQKRSRAKVIKRFYIVTDEKAM
jgi:hypothetical protein